MNKYPTKGPGDFEPDFSDEEAWEAWLDELDSDPHKKLEYLEAWLLEKATATGTIIRADESYCTIHYDHEDAFNDWLQDQYKAKSWLNEY